MSPKYVYFPTTLLAMIVLPLPSGQSPAPTLHFAPLDVAPSLKSWLLDARATTVFTSATLTTDGSFEYIRERLGAMPFAVRDNASGDIVGSTRYFNVDADNRRLEIGHTWYARRAQRTAINTECKLMLLTHAFETLHCIAVEFRTHWFNHRSREAILRLGAKQDGVLRNHQTSPDGSKRDTVVFSIIDGEWPAVKRHLRALLERRANDK